MFFQNAQREKIKKDNPTLKTLPQMAKKMGEIWGKMNDDDKKPYVELATKDKGRFEIENKAYKDKLEKRKKRKRSQRKRKRGRR